MRPLVLLAIFALAIFLTILAMRLFWPEPHEPFEKESGTIFSSLNNSDEYLLPDLAPLPPKDLLIQKEGEKIFLRFSATYFNQGEGPLEMRADEETRGDRGDIERKVFQRIYDKEGGYKDRESGEFLWHQSHLHYHFTGFAEYELELIEESGENILVEAKATFCVKDETRVIKDLPNRSAEAKYVICGKEMQGVSVGWGDTYFYDYPDQALEITDLPSGRYRLVFAVNQEDRFEESDKSNNRSYVEIFINMESLSVSVIREEPDNMPEVEHIFRKEIF